MTRNTLLIGLAVVTLASCSKDEDGGGGSYVPAPAIHALTNVFADNVANATQNFTVDAATGGLVQGTEGTAVLFSANAFRDAQGNTVTGTVNVGLVEALEVADMLWLNKQTVTMQNGERAFLKSGGEIRLTATQGGVALRLAPGASTVYIPTTGASDPGMQLFGAVPDEDGTVIWDPFETNGQAITDTLGYLFPNDSLGWINVDQLYNVPGTRTNADFPMPIGYTAQDTKLWVVFPTENSIAQVYSFSNGVFSLSGGYQLPVGLQVHLVGLHRNADLTFTSATATATVTDGFTVTLDFQPTTLQQWQADCNAL